jgi:hypothetical protein
MINNFKLKGIVFLWLLIGFILPVFAIAAKPIGMVFAISGQVYAKQNKQNEQNKQKIARVRRLRSRSPIFLQDTIITKDNSRTQIGLVDGTLFSVKPNTEFLIKKFKYDEKNPSKRKFVGKLIKGTLVGLSNQSRKADYRLEGSMTTIILRNNAGVVFRVLERQENVGLFAGEISVQSKNNIKVLRNPKHNNYQAVVIKPDGTINPYKGALVRPTPIPASTIYKMQKKNREMLKAIYNMPELKSGMST